MRLSEIMSNMGLTSYAEVGLLIFLGVFIAVVFRVYSKKYQPEYEAARFMPLDDEIVRTPRSVAGGANAGEDR
ncbi:MAG: cbb3-type cytochrome c oxidase subunit 3 [Myxococcales bacterium]|nr:cbb3-type cytochrome c oxidase subunit 3 [Myxococcales bacterium]